MYNECSVNIPIGKKKVKVNYNTEVQQLLFLFMMQAVMDSIIHTDQPLEFRYFPDRTNTKVKPGRLIVQPTKSQGKTFNLDNLLYVDDGSFLFATNDHLEKLPNTSFTISPNSDYKCMWVQKKKNTNQKWKQCTFL